MYTPKRDKEHRRPLHSEVLPPGHYNKGGNARNNVFFFDVQCNNITQQVKK